MKPLLFFSSLLDDVTCFLAAPRRRASESFSIKTPAGFYGFGDSVPLPAERHAGLQPPSRHPSGSLWVPPAGDSRSLPPQLPREQRFLDSAFMACAGPAAAAAEMKLFSKCLNRWPPKNSEGRK